MSIKILSSQNSHGRRLSLFYCINKERMYIISVYVCEYTTKLRSIMKNKEIYELKYYRVLGKTKKKKKLQRNIARIVN